MRRLAPADTWPDLRVAVHVLPWAWRLSPIVWVDDLDGWRGHWSFRWLFLHVEWWGNVPMFREKVR